MRDTNTFKKNNKIRMLMFHRSPVCVLGRLRNKVRSTYFRERRKTSKEIMLI
jgi:hypothetical protein